MTAPAPLPRVALALGYAGLLPQIAALAAVTQEGWRYVGLAAGVFYAALIFSFLGGLWWGVAASRREPPGWVFVASVVPSLIAFASAVPWMVGGDWPGPSLVLLGAGLIAAPLVDARLHGLGLIDRSLLNLRRRLSWGLGALTIALALSA